MKINHERFESLDTFMKVIESRPKNKIMQNANSSRSGSENFTGTRNYEEALELLKNGYDKPLEKIKSGVARDLKISQSRPRRTPQNAVVGFIPNVPNYLLGIPEQMITIHQTPEKVKAISIAYFIGNNCGTGADELEDAGIKILNVINRLELSGIRVNLDVVMMCTHEGQEWQIASVNVKGYREQLDIKKLCFPIANPSMFRRFGFAWLERSTDMKNTNFPYGYGCSAKTHQEEEISKNAFGENELFITQDHVSDLTVDELVELVNKKFKK